MNILTISTLHNRGGAAYIAKTLHDGFKSNGHEVKYLVGYGRRGLKEITSDFSIVYAEYALPIFPHLNYLVHSLIGRDVFSPKQKQLEGLFEWADVIVCHTLHSFYVNFKSLFKLFNELNSKVIFVAHDSWYYTGRCAFVYSCLEWVDGCTSCPNKTFYPSTKFDFARSERIAKVNMINNLENTVFVSPANWICEDVRRVYPQKKCKVIRNGIDTSKFLSSGSKVSETVSLGVSCVGLTQPGKVNLTLVGDLLDLGYKIHFIGGENPYAGHINAINHGYVSDRNQYVQILSEIDCYLFSSTIDIYPTVLVEALCAGKYIFYTDSKGAAEIMESENNWLGSKISTAIDVNQIISSKDFSDTISNLELREEYRQRALSFFSCERMVHEYIELMDLHK